MGEVRAPPVPDRGRDQTVDAERERRRAEAADRGELPLLAATRPREQPEPHGDDHHERDAHFLDVRERRPDRVVMEGDLVDRLVEPPVQHLRVLADGM